MTADLKAAAADSEPQPSTASPADSLSAMTFLMMTADSSSSPQARLRDCGFSESPQAAHWHWHCGRLIGLTASECRDDRDCLISAGKALFLALSVLKSHFA